MAFHCFQLNLTGKDNVTFIHKLCKKFFTHPRAKMKNKFASWYKCLITFASIPSVTHSYLFNFYLLSDRVAYCFVVSSRSWKKILVVALLLSVPFREGQRGGILYFKVYNHDYFAEKEAQNRRFLPLMLSITDQNDSGPDNGISHREL